MIPSVADPVMVTPEVVGHVGSLIAPGAAAFRLVSQYADGVPADASSFLPSPRPAHKGHDAWYTVTYWTLIEPPEVVAVAGAAQWQIASG